MKKKQFVKYMKSLKSILDDTWGVHDAMRKLSPDFGGFNNERAETLIVDILRTAMKDESDWIGYYIYECEWGKKKLKVYKDKKEIKLTTFEDLYNILTK